MKGGVDRIGDRPILSFVHRRSGVHHDKKGKQQRDEIGIRDKPALHVFMLFVLFLFHARYPFLIFFRCPSSRKPSSFSWINRGFSPPAIDINPSIINWRVIASI